MVKKNISLLLAFIAIVLLAVPQAFAGIRLNKNELKNRAAALTSKGTHRRLSRAHELMAKNKVKDAIDVLKRLEKSTAKRPHELAQVLQALGFAYAQKEDFKGALKVMTQALKLNSLPYNPTLSTLYTIAQVQMAQENYKASEQTLKSWFALADEPSPDAYVLLASIHAQKKDQKKALELVTKAIDMTNEPKESWLSFAVAMNYELKRYKEAARLLEKLAGLYPEKKKYWKQLSGVYLNIDKNKQALATLELAHKANYLDKGSEIMNLVSLFLYGGIPLKAANLLEDGLKTGQVKKNQKHYEILGDCWVQAEEVDKALAAYAQSAKFAKDGRIFAKQGRMYLEKEDWKLAEKFLVDGLKKGKIKKPENIHMAIGIARFNMKKFSSAISSFETAKKKSDKVERAADQWIAYVQAEDNRLNPKKEEPAEEEEAPQTL